jgi:surfeit locus 1 family protein
VVTRRTLSITPRGVLGTALVVLVATACVWLGFWQLDRRGQRALRNAGIAARMAEPPVELTRSPRDTSAWLYRRVRIAGSPDAGRAIVLPGRLYRGSPGAHVLAPVPIGPRDAVLVDFGWVPAADGATVDLEALDLGRPLDAVGLVLPFPGEESGARTTTLTSEAAGEFRRVWFAMDTEALRRQFPYELGAAHLQLLPADSAPRLPVRQPAPELDAGPHLGYAIQWFSFATIAIVGWMVIVAKGNVRRTPEPTVETGR